MSKVLKEKFLKKGTEIKKIIVAIHGWQGDYNSMVPISNLIKIPNVAWHIPQAPYKVKDGFGYSWSYQHSNGDWEVEEPKKILNQYFTELFSKYDSKNIYVIGFSQGAMICFDFVLFLKNTLGGVFPICGFLRNPNPNIPRFHPSQNKTPILIGHGKNDDVVPPQSSQKAYDLLENQGANVNLLFYNGQHKISMDYIKNMIEYINE